MLNDKADILDVGFIIVFIIVLAVISKDFMITLLPIGYVSGMVIRPKAGVSTISEVRQKYYQSVVLVTVSVYAATHSLLYTAEIALIIKASELVAKKTPMGWTGLVFGNVHISILLNFMIGLAACYKNTSICYFIAGMTFGYLCAVTDVVLKHGFGVGRE